MPLTFKNKIEFSGRDRYSIYHVYGLSKEMAKYEKDIVSGKIKCPFKVKFFDTDGNLVAKGFIPLTPNGKPKIKIFD